MKTIQVTINEDAISATAEGGQSLPIKWVMSDGDRFTWNGSAFKCDDDSSLSIILPAGKRCLAYNVNGVLRINEILI